MSNNATNKNAECTLWKAPNLNPAEEIEYDFKLTSPESIKHREQQQKIRQQAYEKSFAKGYMEGLAQGQREINEHMEYLQSLVTSFSMPINGLDDTVVDELVQLSMSVITQIIKCELKISPEEILLVIKEVLSILPVTATDICVQLHPDDAQLVRDSLQGDNAMWRIQELTTIERGGCCISTSTSHIDASIDSRIRSVLAEVMGTAYIMSEGK